MKAFSSVDEAMGFLEEEKEKQQKEYESNRNPKNFRFFVKKGNSTNIILLDDLLFPVYEHRFKKDGHYNNFETCTKELEGECPLCESDNKPYLAMVTTIIDLTPYERKDGTKVEASKKLMVVKKGNAEKYLRRQKNMGTLVGKKFNVYRSSDPKGEATGTDLEYEKDVDIEILKQFAPDGVDPNEWLQPYDYKELFAPKSVAELRNIIGLSDPIGSEDSQPTTNHPPKQSLADLV